MQTYPYSFAYDTEEDIYREVKMLTNPPLNTLDHDNEALLIKLGLFILQNWDIEVHSIQVIQGNQMALVWKIETNRGFLCLKRLHRPEKKAQFSIYAQNYLAEKGFKVPSIYETKNNKLYTKFHSFLFVVYDWIEGTPFDFEVKEDLKMVMGGLAAYHRESIGYFPPTGIDIFSKLGKLPVHYTKRCQQLDSWKLVAKSYQDDTFAKLYLEEIDFFIKEGKKILSEIEQSSYQDWIENVKKSPTLCHQDYGTGNTLRGLDGDIWIIDLDTTSFDLPIRDLRKMIVPMLNSTTSWNEMTFYTMLDAYESITPLTVEQKKIMYLDMLFPYELYDVVRDKFIRKSPFSEKELMDAMAYERIKKAAISKLL